MSATEWIRLAVGLNMSSFEVYALCGVLLVAVPIWLMQGAGIRNLLLLLAGVTIGHVAAQLVYHWPS
jgi:hypothetical protein